MSDRFNDSQMLKLVETYRDHQCLWNATHPLYKNRESRENAYKQIWKKLNIPGMSPRDIPKKIKNMRSSYYQELKKIEKSTRPGVDEDSIYKPKVSWFKAADGFLQPFRNHHPTFSNVFVNTNATSGIMITKSESVEDEFWDDNSNTADEQIEEDSSDTTRAESDQNEASPQFIVPSKKPIRKRGKSDKDLRKAINKIDKIAKTITNNTNTYIENKEDEYDIFGKYIASTLRSLPGEFAIMAKTEVQKALSHIQLNALRKNESSNTYGGGVSTFLIDNQNSEYFSSASESICSNYDDDIKMN